MQPSFVAPLPIVDRQVTLSEFPGKNEAYSAGISWAAVFGGAFIAASFSLILLALATGLGFSAVSPWSDTGAAASTIGKAAIAWLIASQVIAFAFGGYVSGRLRTKWVQVHNDEVFFRDTAHGLLVWAVGVVLTAAFLTSAATSLAGRPSQDGANRAGTTSGADEAIPNANAYFIDTMFRGSGSASDRSDVSGRSEAERIFVHSLGQGSMTATDRTYLAEMVSARAGLNQTDAENRVSSVFSEAQESADVARKALAHLSLWLFVALLSGAFCASYAGTIGGKQRDHVSA
jgi:hypothetical protein